MILDRRSVSLQVMVLMAIVLAVLAGLSGLLAAFMGDVADLPAVFASPINCFILLLAGGCLLAEIRRARRAKFLLASGLFAVGVYYSFQAVIAELEKAAFAPSVALASSLFAVLLALLVLVPRGSRIRLRAWRLCGASAVGIGACGAALGMLLPASHDMAFLIPSVAGSLWLVLLGGVACILPRFDEAGNLKLPSMIVGLCFISLSVGLVFSFSVVLFQHHERRQSAALLLEGGGSFIVARLESHSVFLEGIADRWKALGGLPGPAILDAESRRLFNGPGHFTAFGYVDQSNGTFWRNGRDAEALLWLDEQLLDPAVRQWISWNRKADLHVSWRFVPGAVKKSALLWVQVPGRPGAYLVAEVDTAALVNEAFLSWQGEFRINVGVNNREGVSPGPASFSSQSEKDNTLFAQLVLPVPGSSGLRLSATGQFLNLGSISGLVSVGAFVLMAVLSYYFLMTQAVIWWQRKRDQKLRRSEHRFRSLFAQNPNIVFALDTTGRFTEINPETEIAVGQLETELVGAHYAAIERLADVSVRGYPGMAEPFRQALAGQTVNFQLDFKKEHRPVRVYDVTLIPIAMDAEIEGVFGVAQDITDRVIVEQKQQVLLRSLEASGNAVMVCDARERGFPVVYVNPAFSRITGYSSAEVLGGDPTILIDKDTESEEAKKIMEAVSARKPLSIIIRSYRRDGNQFWNQLSLSPVTDDQQTLTHYIAVINDISEQKEQDQQLAFQATHDVLTGLGNRSLFDDRIAHDFALARRNGSTLAVFFIDLDEFKPINDTLGHKIGDAVLVSVTRRLSANLRPSDTLCRFGGDEFVLLVPDLSDESEAEDIAERLLEELSSAHRIEGHELHVSASIGIATMDKEVTEPEKLVQHADMAMYKAKQRGRNTYEVYCGNLDAKLNARVSLRNELQEAIAGDQLCLHYQPLRDASGQIEGLEALVRWQHPEKGWISPADFIPLAEQTGQIAPLSRWILERACRDALALADEGLLFGRMAVNLSPVQFHRPNFLSVLRKTLEKTGLPANRLELELTEGILMQDTEGAIDILNALNGMGVSTAIDDFGTGYSSLSYLRTLPIDKVKIDKSFVKNVTDNHKDAAICKGVIALARELDLRVVAEGVELQEQYDYLRSCGCDVFQGYLLAYPMPFEKLTEWLLSDGAQRVFMAQDGIG